MTNYDRLLQEMRDLGMDYKWSKMFVKKFSDDEAAFQVTDEQRKWAMERGFFPGRAELFGLTEENYRNYVPDFNYFMLHPMNHHFRIWVNDKLTLKYVLNSAGYADTMPEYYLYVENDGNYTYLMDCPDDIKKDKDFVWNLLQAKKVLAIKPNSGTSGGRGFVKLELRGQTIFENNRPISMDHFQEIVSEMRNHIVTEYVRQHRELAEVWPDSECTLRIIMCKGVKKSIYDPDKWSCVASFARFGSAVSGGASNLSSGGIGAGFDYQTGEYGDFCIRFKRFCPDGIWHMPMHPDTKYAFQGRVFPNWQYVREKINEICAYIDSLSYLGFDIIVTDDGMKLCEINTHPAMDYEQVMNGAPLVKKDVREYFMNKGLFQYDGAAYYQAYLRCLE